MRRSKAFLVWGIILFIIGLIGLVTKAWDYLPLIERLAFSIGLIVLSLVFLLLYLIPRKAEQSGPVIIEEPASPVTNSRYKRQLWSSGYEYHIRCPYCSTLSKYTDDQLEYRSWYPNGFVYCPKCRKPLQHNEIYAVNSDGTPVYFSQEEANNALRNGYLKVTGANIEANEKTENGTADQGYCPDCGRTYIKGKDRFCPGCGKKFE